MVQPVQDSEQSSANHEQMELICVQLVQREEKYGTKCGFHRTCLVGDAVVGERGVGVVAFGGDGSRRPNWSESVLGREGVDECSEKC